MNPAESSHRTLAQTLASVSMQGDGQRYTGHAEFTPDWAQGRSIYGGVAAAVLLQAMRAHVPAERQLRSMMVSFVGPIAPGEVAQPNRVSIEVQVLREGRSASQLEAKILQDGQVATAIQAAFAGDRQSVIHLEAPPRPDAPPPEQGIAFPSIPGITPAFTEHLDYRMTSGRLPFMGSDQAQHGGWLKYKDITDVPTEQLIVALADALPPAALQMLKQPVPASSLTWSLDLTDQAASCDPQGWWYMQASADAGADGYTQQQSHLWTPDGQMAVFDYQTVAIFG